MLKVKGVDSLKNLSAHSFLNSFRLLTGNNQRETKKEIPEYELVSECNYLN